jgi:hypothetical protein
MSDDFYLDSARRQLAMLDAERQATLADLSTHRLNQDRESAAACVQALADLDAKRQNLTALADQYIQSQQPPPPESPEMKAAKPISEMNYADVYEWVKKNSKIGIDDDAFRRGIDEVKRRRQRGE